MSIDEVIVDILLSITVAIPVLSFISEIKI